MLNKASSFLYKESSFSMQFRDYNFSNKRQQNIIDTENLHLQKWVESSRLTAEETEIYSNAWNLHGLQHRKLKFTARFTAQETEIYNNAWNGVFEFLEE